MADHNRFARAERALRDALTARVFPCAVAEVGRSRGAIRTWATGRLTYEPDAPDATPDTVFDLASLTKVIATATTALLQVASGRVSLEAKVADHLPGWAQEDRRTVTVRDLLEHCSGLPAHRTYYLERSGRAAFETAICAEPLAYPPRTASVYSDPGFMLLGFLLEDTGGRALDAQFDQWKEHAGIEGAITYHPSAEWRERIAPTELDPWRGRLLVGEVHDENAAALGGVAAHAGLFGTAAATGACARWWLSLLMGTDDGPTGVSSREAAVFATRSKVPASSRALAWDTMLPSSSCGTRLSARAVGHTGFTGTSLWLDPEQDLYVVLLTNRVHPTRDNEGIQAVRRAFHDAVVADLQETL